MVSPQTGMCVSIVEMPDEVFSERILGDGIAVIPEENEVLSPVDGEVVQVAQTGHAFCIKSNDGVEIMIHIGVDTVELKGEGFECFVKPGDKVKKGDKLATADIKMIKEKGYPLHTAMVITNGKELSSMEGLYGEVVAGKDAVINYIKKNYESGVNIELEKLSFQCPSTCRAVVHVPNSTSSNRRAFARNRSIFIKPANDSFLRP